MAFGSFSVLDPGYENKVLGNKLAWIFKVESCYIFDILNVNIMLAWR